MAKRFGRNQRRHLREEIARKDAMLREALDLGAARTREAAALRNRLETWAGEILDLMGPDSAFNEQLARYACHDYLSELRLQPIRRPPVGRYPDAPTRWAQPEAVITACILRCQIKSDDLAEMLAVEIGNERGALVGYGLPNDRRKQWTQRDIRYVAHLIAEKMAQYLRVKRDEAA